MSDVKTKLNVPNLVICNEIASKELVDKLVQIRMCNAGWVFTGTVVKVEGGFIELVDTRQNKLFVAVTDLSSILVKPLFNQRHSVPYQEKVVQKGGYGDVWEY